jgi:hypothetical protein
LISASTRFKIIGTETFAVGAFLLLTFFLNLSGTKMVRWLPRVGSDLPIMGGALVFIGLEIFSLIKHLPSPVSLHVGQQTSSGPSTTTPSEGRLISVRKLVVLDMTLHGRRLILLEFGISAPGMIAAGLFIILRGYWPLGTYLLLLGVNYVPLLMYALALSRRPGEVAKQHGPGQVRIVRKYGAQQTILLVPFAIPIMAILQRSVQSSSPFEKQMTG